MPEKGVVKLSVPLSEDIVNNLDQETITKIRNSIHVIINPIKNSDLDLDDIRKDLANHIFLGKKTVSEKTLRYFRSARFVLKSFLPKTSSLNNINNANAKFLVRYINILEGITKIKSNNFILRELFDELSILYKDVIDAGARKFKNWALMKEFLSIPDIIRGNIETLCQHYSTTFGWQPHIQESEKKFQENGSSKESYCPLFITKGSFQKLTGNLLKRFKDSNGNLHKLGRDLPLLQKIFSEKWDLDNLTKKQAERSMEVLKNELSIEYSENITVVNFLEFERKVENTISEKGENYPLKIRKRLARSNYIASYYIGGEEENFEIVKGEVDEILKKFQKFLLSDGLYKLDRKNKDDENLFLKNQKKETENYLIDLLRPDRFLEASDKILYKVFKYIYQYGDSDIRNIACDIIPSIREGVISNDKYHFCDTLPEIIKFLYSFACSYDENQIDFVDCYSNKKIFLADIIINRIWEWLYHFKFRFSIYKEILAGESITSCLKSAYKNTQDPDKPTEEIKYENPDLWDRVVEILKKEQVDSDSPEMVLDGLIEYFSSAEEFDNFCITNIIRPDIRDILLTKKPHLTNKTKAKYENDYNIEVTKRKSTNESIEEEIDGSKKASERVLEDKKDEVLIIPNSLNDIFKEDEDSFNYYLNKLNFIVSDDNINMLNSQNFSAYKSLIKNIQTLELLQQYARSLDRAEDFEKIELLIFSILDKIYTNFQKNQNKN